VIQELRVAAALGRRAIKQAFRRPQFLAPTLIFPTLFLAVNTGGAGRAVDIPEFPDVNGFLDFQLAGAMLQSTMLAGLSSGIALALDIEGGFIDRLMAAPISRWSVVAGRLAGAFAVGMLAVAWFIAIGLIFGAEIGGGVLGVALLLVLAPLASVAFGGISSAIALRSGHASVVQSAFPLVFVILFLSSAFFPRQLLLEPAGSIADWNPLSFIAEGLRDTILYDISAEPIAKALAGIGVMAAIGLVFSATAIRARLRAA